MSLSQSFTEINYEALPDVRRSNVILERKILSQTLREGNCQI